MGSASQLGVVSCNSSPNGSIVLSRLLAGWHYMDFFKNFLKLSLMANLFSKKKCYWLKKMSDQNDWGLVQIFTFYSISHCLIVPVLWQVMSRIISASNNCLNHFHFCSWCWIESTSLFWLHWNT
jgi:hypothetical protein